MTNYRKVGRFYINPDAIDAVELASDTSAMIHLRGGGKIPVTGDAVADVRRWFEPEQPCPAADTEEMTVRGLPRRTNRTASRTRTRSPELEFCDLCAGFFASQSQLGLSIRRD